MNTAEESVLELDLIFLVIHLLQVILEELVEAFLAEGQKGNSEFTQLQVLETGRDVSQT